MKYTLSLRRTIVSVFVHYFIARHHRYILFHFHEFLRSFRITLHYVVETHHCRQFVAIDNAQLSAFAEFGKERLDGFSVVSLGPIERVRQILILLPGRRLPIGHCISMMLRDKIDPNDAEKLDRNGHCRVLTTFTIVSVGRLRNPHHVHSRRLSCNLTQF